MKLTDSLESTGSWLFRYRSFFPLCAVPLMVAGLTAFRYIGDSHALTEAWVALSFLVSLLGLALRAFTVGHVPKRTSGRNTRTQMAACLNTSGIYSVVRHPLYLGNYLAVLGVALFFRSAWIVLLLTCLFVLYYERIMCAEEKFLAERFGDEFERWVAVTPAVFPNFRRWSRPVMPFCWRTALRREYMGVLLVLGGFALLDSIADSLAEGRWHMDVLWAGMLAGAMGIFVVLRSLKKYTRVLDVVGR